ncbi:hypothetical protein IMAU50151_00208 [Lactobacillus helveticus]|nr:hypothetical protein [Lactobacillus helveticus]
MARRKKKKSGFQKLTIVMAWLMAVITLAAVVAGAVGQWPEQECFKKKRREKFSRLFLFLYAICI